MIIRIHRTQIAFGGDMKSNRFRHRFIKDLSQVTISKFFMSIVHSLIGSVIRQRMHQMPDVVQQRGCDQSRRSVCLNGQRGTLQCVLSLCDGFSTLLRVATFCKQLDDLFNGDHAKVHFHYGITATRIGRFLTANWNASFTSASEKAFCTKSANGNC